LSNESEIGRGPHTCREMKILKFSANQSENCVLQLIWEFGLRQIGTIGIGIGIGIGIVCGMMYV
jgi:hypothetical protein